METVNVELAGASYPIYIGEHLLQQSQLFSQHIHSHQLMVVTNQTVASLYLEQLTAGLTDIDWDHCLLPDGERYKNVDSLMAIIDHLVAHHHHRDTTVLALGGGVVGDIAGFAAACYMRGVELIQVPTTLLAQVDSAVGGKTAVNHPQGKNLVGAFYQPACVVIDVSTLNTLADRELHAGIAEVIKYAVIFDKQFFHWLEQNMQAILERDMAALTHVVRRCCEIKAAVVAADEREKGQRALLNFGHTFGHAIESDQGYGQYLHGEAVAIGMVIASQLSVALGLLAESEARRVTQLIKAAQLPTRAPMGMSVSHCIKLMGMDKKVINNQLRFILVDKIGHGVVDEQVSETLLNDVLVACGMSL